MMITVSSQTAWDIQHRFVATKRSPGDHNDLMAPRLPGRTHPAACERSSLEKLPRKNKPLLLCILTPSFINFSATGSAIKAFLGETRSKASQFLRGRLHPPKPHRAQLTAARTICFFY